jgi:glycosyltransferase involved in cell wall biosynthesis
LRSSEVLFLGKHTGVVSWYRTGSPSFYLGCDWAGVAGEPPDLELAAALKRGGQVLPKMEDYKIVVVQQRWGRKWMHEILKLKDKGVIVLYEIDDYLHGVRKIKGHAGQKVYSKNHVMEHERVMKICDGMIVSTPYLAEVYKGFHDKIFVCKNAIERARYEKLAPPKRDKLHIGWAGGEGHQASVPKWIPALQKIMDNYDVRFISIGIPLANELAAPGRTMALPFVPIENVPSVLCNIDIAIAPSARGKFFRAKSDLRFLEFGALGIPLVADPYVYTDVKDEETGLLATESDEAYEQLARLIDDKELRTTISTNVRSYVFEHRSMDEQCSQWSNAFLSLEAHS